MILILYVAEKIVYSDYTGICAGQCWRGIVSFPQLHLKQYFYSMHCEMELSNVYQSDFLCI